MLLPFACVLGMVDFHGGLWGVHAHVRADDALTSANITLRCLGVRFASGTARKCARGFEVDAALADTLKRRGVRLERIDVSDAAIVLVAKLPPGTREVVLLRR